MASFRIQTKSLFLTFPQCDTSPTRFQQLINQFFGDNLEKGVVCQEDHKDEEGLHLHAAICLKERFRSSDPRVFDGLVDPAKHPHIQTKFHKGVLKAFQYVMKDGNYLPLGRGFDLEEFLKAALAKKNTKTSLILKDIKSGQKLDDLVEDHSEFLLHNLKKVKEYLDFLELRERRLQFVEAQTRKVRVQPAAPYLTNWNREIASWLNLNLRSQRAHRQKQLWICARPGMGKTSLIMMLEKAYDLSVYYWPKEEVWWDAYSDGAYDLIVLDEFHSQKTITQLNPILSGDPTPLSRRCSAPLVKRDNLPVIILSNYLPEECFSKVAANAPSKLEPLIDRLTIVSVDGPIRMAPLSDDVQAELDPPPAPLPAPYSPNILSDDGDDFPQFPATLLTSCSECDGTGDECGSCDGCCGCICHAEDEFERNNNCNWVYGGYGRARLLRATDSLTNQILPQNSIRNYF